MNFFKKVLWRTRHVRLVSVFFLRKKNVNPVFIIGPGRSGTTVLAKILECHPHLHCFPSEGNRLWHPLTYPWKKDSKEISTPIWMNGQEFSQFSIANHTQRTIVNLKFELDFFATLEPNKQFILKSAMITYMVPFIKKLYPTARFIYLLRDGRSVALSYSRKQFNKNQKESGMQYSFDDLLKFTSIEWQRHLEFVEQLSINDEEMMIIRYEDMIQDMNKVLTQIAKFLNVNPSDFKTDILPKFRNENSKLNDSLEVSQLTFMTELMKTGLTRYGYLNQ